VLAAGEENLYGVGGLKVYVIAKAKLQSVCPSKTRTTQSIGICYLGPRAVRTTSRRQNVVTPDYS
jgi:hypothetical protein